MEIRFPALVGQGPEGQPAVPGLEDGADAGLQGQVGGNNGGQINLQGQRQGPGLQRTVKGSAWKAGSS